MAQTIDNNLEGWKEEFEQQFAAVIGHPLHARIPLEDFISSKLEAVRQACLGAAPMIEEYPHCECEHDVCCEPNWNDAIEEYTATIKSIKI